MAEKKYRNRNLFDYLGNILTEKSKEKTEAHISDPEFEPSFQPVVIMNYLSMSPDPKVRQIIMDRQLQLDRMTDKATFYRLLVKIIPKQRNPFIRYIK